MGKVIKKTLKVIIITIAVVTVASMYFDYCQREYEWAVENNIAVDEFRAIPKKLW